MGVWIFESWILKNIFLNWILPQMNQWRYLNFFVNVYAKKSLPCQQRIIKLYKCDTLRTFTAVLKILEKSLWKLLLSLMWYKWQSSVKFSEAICTLWNYFSVVNQLLLILCIIIYCSPSMSNFPSISSLFIMTDTSHRGAMHDWVLPGLLLLSLLYFNEAFIMLHVFNLSQCSKPTIDLVYI